MAKNDIITYEQLKGRYGNIQRGINYGKGVKPTIILMSVRVDSPYVDKEGIDNQIVYEGEDAYGNPSKKFIDQEPEEVRVLLVQGRLRQETVLKSLSPGLSHPSSIKNYLSRPIQDPRVP